MSPMYNDEKIMKTLDRSYMSEYLLQAQWAEFIKLKEVITELLKTQDAPLSVLDIGVGDGRIPLHLSGLEELWGMIGSYDGIENSNPCIEQARKNVREKDLESKVHLFQLDARDLETAELLRFRTYDLVLCTYFTAGNFAVDDFSFEPDESGTLHFLPHLDSNLVFEKVFLSAYGLLRPQGEIVLGSVYIDNPATRKKQEQFYRNCGMEVITPPDCSFTATREGFWSQRFTEDKIYGYFHWVKPRNVHFLPLDTYQFAAMVRVVKEG